ncbi:hypothetical protein [Piscinibacter sakaiensis]|uniref:hypothetical protein n=1 Tax=Piscinibacter sakaiensis TaxID=1547922 RepID=UPI003AAF2069
MRLSGRLLLLLLPLSTAASAAGSFETPACRGALERLHAVEETRRAERGSGGRGAGPLVEQARQRAATECLGRAADPQLPPPSRISPPVTVGPVAAPPSIANRAPPTAPSPPPPAPGSQPPTIVTRCDSAGCWTSDGRYLIRVGPDLASPAALCSINAGVLHCR